MRAGAVIGIPLTLLQLAVHHHHPSVEVAPVDVANNFLVSHAIYDADRIGGAPWSAARRSTLVASVASCAYYASEPATLALAPSVLALNGGYAVLKPAIAPVKPFFVSTFWTAAVYYAPLWRVPADGAAAGLADVVTPAALFLSVAALSHCADIVDRNEDAADGVRTPAVLMGDAEARAFAVAGVLGATVLHQASPVAWLPYDAATLGVVLGVVLDDARVSVATAALVAAATLYHDYLELASQLLRSTEVSHELAIEATVEFVERLQTLPPELRKPAVDAVFDVLDAGDAFGSAMLRMYEALVRARL